MQRKTVLIAIFLFWQLMFSQISTAQVISNCAEATAQIDLSINNVRAGLLTGGDMFWDPFEQNPKYEVPAGSGINSIFAAALWMGGRDEYGALKVAAQTYRQGGNDYWPGPINGTGSITFGMCADFDRHFEVLASDIDQYRADLAAAGGVLPIANIPESILQWPARNNPHFTLFDLPADKDFAPFWNADSDPSSYDPTQGDYPVLDSAVEGVYADQMVWWIINDLGNMHTETGGDIFGIEISTLAYAYASSIESVNNTTFYKYRIAAQNWDIHDYYFGLWIDPDLGDFFDDFVGCMPEWNTGYVYNGDAVDGEYGEDPPILGVRFLDGLKSDTGEPLGMTSFMAYNNNFSSTGNPENAMDFYEYLRGIWKDGTPITEGGNGYGGTEPTNFMYPGNPSNADEWSECGANSEPADRRFLMGSGPGSLLVGSVQEINVAVYWTRPQGVYPCPDNEHLTTVIEEVDVFLGDIDVSVPSPIQATTAVSLVPNPMTDRSLLTIITPQAATKTVALYAADGRVVRSYELDAASQSLSIERGTLPAGIYFYEVRLEKGLLQAGKLVVQ